MFCSKCGTAVGTNAAFCQRCGSPVARDLAAPVSVPMVSPHSGVGAIAYVANVAYAGFWLRLAAYLIDKIILGVLSALLVVPLFFLFGGAAYLEKFSWGDFEGFVLPPQWQPLVLLLLVLLGIATILQWLYFAYQESGEQQATWGKQLMHIYVTDLEGHRISFSTAGVRYFSKFVTNLIPAGIGFIMAGFTERRQALHDMIAATLVLRR